MIVRLKGGQKKLFIKQIFLVLICIWSEGAFGLVLSSCWAENQLGTWTGVLRHQVVWSSAKKMPKRQEADFSEKGLLSDTPPEQEPVLYCCCCTEEKWVVEVSRVQFQPFPIAAVWESETQLAVLAGKVQPEADMHNANPDVCTALCSALNCPALHCSLSSYLAVLMQWPLLIWLCTAQLFTLWYSIM